MSFSAHLPVAPILLPFFTACALLALGLDGRRSGRTVSALSAGAGVALALLLVDSAARGTQAYALGDWPAPYGIVLVADRLSAMMVALCAVVAAGALAAAIGGGADRLGRHFHALFHFQLMGLNGAFLTGDLFNLFVFFEVLLIASYCLLLHGGGTARLRSAFHYVALNLAGSALFLIAVALLYAVTGTLNMADLALRVRDIAPADAALARSAGLLLLAVFALKAAAFPLGFWLPATYTSASLPVAALFALMTKVGVYAIARVYTLVFGADAGPAANLAWPVLLPAGLATLAMGTIGALAARTLGQLAANLTIASSGTLLAALALGSAHAMQGAFYYLLHSTVGVAALFLLTDAIAVRRGADGDRLAAGGALERAAAPGVLFMLIAAALVGLPPLSGFIGKVMILQSAATHAHAAWLWLLVLASGGAMLIAFARAGSSLFWASTTPPPPGNGRPPSLLPALALAGCALALVIWAAPVERALARTAEDLARPEAYMRAVLGEAYLGDKRALPGQPPGERR